MLPNRSPLVAKRTASRYLGQVRPSPYSPRHPASGPSTAGVSKRSFSKNSVSTFKTGSISGASDLSSGDFKTETSSLPRSPQQVRRLSTIDLFEYLQEQQSSRTGKSQEHQVFGLAPLAGADEIFATSSYDEELPPPVVNVDHLRGYPSPIKDAKPAQSVATTAPEIAYTNGQYRRNPSYGYLDPITENDQPATGEHEEQDAGTVYTGARARRPEDFASSASSLSQLTHETSLASSAFFSALSQTPSQDSQATAPIPVQSRVEIHRSCSVNTETASFVTADPDLTPTPSPMLTQACFDIPRTQSVSGETDTETYVSSTIDDASVHPFSDRPADSWSQCSWLSAGSEESMGSNALGLSWASIGTIRPSDGQNGASDNGASTPTNLSSQTSTQSGPELVTPQGSQPVQQDKQVPRPLARSMGSVIRIGTEWEHENLDGPGRKGIKRAGPVYGDFQYLN